MQRAATFLAFIISRKFSRVKRALWRGENRPCRFSRDAKPGFVVRKLKASLVKRALFLPRFFSKRQQKTHALRRGFFRAWLKKQVNQITYFLRARAPAAATETTARETARPTKSSAPVAGFGLLVEGVSVVGSEGVTGSAGVSFAGCSSWPSSSVDRT